ncbi:hypothetical protein [Jiulongibacter sediminis]|nr:hypothetical protein [Jiulongibacter sediminis]
MKDLVMALGQIIGVFFVIATAAFAVNFILRGFSSVNKNEMNYYKK